MNPACRLSVAVAVVAVAGTVLWGCGSPQTGQPSAIASGQAPVGTYADTGSTGTASPQPSATATGSGGGTSPADAADLKRVELVGVGIGADDKYISVQFKAPPRLARKWQPGMLYVVDERTDLVYDKVPNVPILGSLLGRPMKEGQIGYVMLVNSPPLQSGDEVTVVLGEFKQQHVVVQ
jgi:hypothetical protein